MHRILLFSLSTLAFNMSAQTGNWQLWASGLPAGTYPKLTVAPNHDIFYTLIGTGGPKGVIHKANTQNSLGTFTALPTIPLPASLVNNINALETNQLSEPIAGVFRNNVQEPWLFRLDHTTQQWVAAMVDLNPTLGAFCMARSPNGTLWAGAKWSYVYKSTDNGLSFTHIDESALVKAAYPCYYPSWIGYDYDGAIYGVQADKNGRVYVGTESAGMLFSDDEGLSWQPADLDACKDLDPTQKDSSSNMIALSMGGNCAAVGFTSNNQLVWSGANMWALNWKNKLGLANLSTHSVKPCLGLPDYLVQTGQQVSRIVTASNGQLFLHSGGAANTAGVGIYTSMDGENWTAFNNGISGQNDGQSQGSLAVDSNMVFMATHDGKIWRYIVPGPISSTSNALESRHASLQPNPADDQLQIKLEVEADIPVEVCIFNASGNKLLHIGLQSPTQNLDISHLPNGFYGVQIRCGQQVSQSKLVIIHN